MTTGKRMRDPNNPFEPSLAADPIDQDRRNHDLAGNGTGDNGLGGMTLAGWAFTGMIITVALAKGTVVMGLLLWFISTTPGDAGENQTILVAIGLGIFLVNLVAAFLLPAMIRSKAATRLREANDAFAMARPWSQWPEREPMPMPLSRFCQADQTARLTGQAILEGTAVLNLILMFLTRSPVNLMCAVVSVVGLLATFPTIGRMRLRIESTLEA